MRFKRIPTVCGVVSSHSQERSGCPSACTSSFDSAFPLRMIAHATSSVTSPFAGTLTEAVSVAVAALPFREVFSAFSVAESSRMRPGATFRRIRAMRLPGLPPSRFGSNERISAPFSRKLRCAATFSRSARAIGLFFSDAALVNTTSPFPHLR